MGVSSGVPPLPHMDRKCPKFGGQQFSHRVASYRAVPSSPGQVHTQGHCNLCSPHSSHHCPGKRRACLGEEGLRGWGETVTSGRGRKHL